MRLTKKETFHLKRYHTHVPFPILRIVIGTVNYTSILTSTGQKEARRVLCSRGWWVYNLREARAAFPRQEGKGRAHK